MMTDQKRNADPVEKMLRHLASEHAQERDDALAWLIANPGISHARLVEAVKAGEYRQETLGSIYALGQIGDEADVALLEEVMLSGSSLSWESTQALGRHRAAEALDVLLNALGNSKPEIAGAALIALGKRGDGSARRKIEQSLSCGDESVRYRAVFALHDLGTGPSREALEIHRGAESSADVIRLIDEVLNE
jgi:HEAT repeat protein